MGKFSGKKYLLFLEIDSEIHLLFKQPTNRPRVVKRGIEDFNIEDGECEKIDHLLFMIHGIGKCIYLTILFNFLIFIIFPIFT